MLSNSSWLPTKKKKVSTFNLSGYLKVLVRGSWCNFKILLWQRRWTSKQILINIPPWCFHGPQFPTACLASRNFKLLVQKKTWKRKIFCFHQNSNRNPISGMGSAVNLNVGTKTNLRVPSFQYPLKKRFYLQPQPSGFTHLHVKTLKYIICILTANLTSSRGKQGLIASNSSQHMSTSSFR